MGWDIWKFKEFDIFSTDRSWFMFNCKWNFKENIPVLDNLRTNSGKFSKILI